MTPILRVTNGYDGIDLINTKGQGFYLSKWKPLTSDYKDGGVYQNNQMSDNRGLINARYDNVTESFDLVLKGDSPDELSRLLHILIKLGVLSTQNWIAPYMGIEIRPDNGLYTVSKPVWIEARANRESMTRYATVTKARIPELENPYSGVFAQKDCSATMNEITLELERMHWQTVKPGEAELQTIANYTLDVSAPENEKTPEWGRINGTTGEILYSTDRYTTFVGNKDTRCTISLIYIDQGGVFTANLQTEPFPVGLVSPTIGHITYFGNPPLSTSAQVGGTFSSIVANLQTPGFGYEGVWEYWNGAAWFALDVQDNSLDGTTSFRNTENTSIFWRQPTDWATTTVNGQLGWWVRFRVTVAAGILISPTVDTYRPYAVNWAFIEVNSNEINGEIQALAQIELEDVSDVEGDSIVMPALFVDRYIVGLRSVSRDIDNYEQFRSRLNTGENNPNKTVSGTRAITETLGTDTTHTVNPLSPVGSSAKFNTVGATLNWETRYTWNIPYPCGINWFGTFRIFARIMQNLPIATFDTVAWRIKAYIGDNFEVFISDEKYITENFAFFLLDFGNITIASDVIQTFENPYVNDISIVGGVGQGASVKFEIQSRYINTIEEEVDFDILDIILIPADEMIVECVNNSFNEEQSLGYTGTTRPVTLYIDSANYWKNTARSLLYRKAINASPIQEVFSVWQTKGSQPVTLQTKTKQRLWVLSARKYNPLVSIDDWRSNHEQVTTVRIRKVERYLTFAGDGRSE